MASLVAYIKKASNPSPAIESVLSFFENIDGLEKYISLINNNSEEIRILLTHQGFNPDERITKINNVIKSFKSISMSLADVSELNETIEKNYGLKLIGVGAAENVIDGIIIAFKKMDNCVI